MERWFYADTPKEVLTPYRKQPEYKEPLAWKAFSPKDSRNIEVGYTSNIKKIQVLDDALFEADIDRLTLSPSIGT